MSIHILSSFCFFGPGTIGVRYRLVYHRLFISRVPLRLHSFVLFRLLVDAMASLLKALVFVAAVKQVLGSCAYGTFLHPRAEEGEQIPISTFAYSGSKVSFHTRDT